MAIARNLPVTTHGRYLIEAPTHARPAGLLVGCHGYGESADVQLRRLRSIPDENRWLLVSVQGLHRFYRGRTEEVVASWMTRQDREHAIGDNIAFLSAVIDDAVREFGVEAPLVFAGFSQGVAMAFRAAVASARQVSAVIAVGGDVPPELTADGLARVGRVLLARGVRDEWYGPEKWQADEARLRGAGVAVRIVGYDGGHEWGPEVGHEAGTLLQELGR